MTGPRKETVGDTKALRVPDGSEVTGMAPVGSSNGNSCSQADFALSAPDLNPELHSNGEQVSWKWGLMDLPCKHSLFFWQHCEAQGTVAAFAALGLLFLPDPGCCRSTPWLHSCSCLTPCRSCLWVQWAVLKSVLGSKAWTLPGASFGSASLGEQLQWMAQGKESQSSSSHSKINSSQEILLLKNFRVASSWIPDSWEIQFLLFLCHWGRTGKNLSLHWGHSLNCHCFHVQCF